MTETNENKESCENLCNLVVEKRKGKMLKDERGQMSIDFLVGISLFILTLLFMVHFIPGMFVPFQSETIDLSSVAYRTSVILVEDPGWWSYENGTDKDEDWENHIENVSRVGLAIDKEHPNMLNMSKIDVFNNESLIDNTTLTQKLVLYRNIGGNLIYYGYNMRIEDLNENILATRGASIPEYGDVSSMKRLVKAHTGAQIIMGWDELRANITAANDTALFNITEPKENVTLIIEDILVQAPNKPELNYTKINNNTKSINTDYWVWIDNGTGYFEQQVSTPIDLPPSPFNTTSRLKITIKNTAFDAGINQIEIKFVQVIITEGDATNLDEKEKYPIFEPAILTVKVWT